MAVDIHGNLLPTKVGAANRIADALFAIAKQQRGLVTQAARQNDATEALLEIQKAQLGVTEALETQLRLNIANTPGSRELNNGSAG